MIRGSEHDRRTVTVFSPFGFRNLETCNMRQVNWNRTRWLLAFAILSSVIGFGGYATSIAQEPTPAQADGKKPKGARPTTTTVCTCPKFLYMTMPTGNGNELVYYYYAEQYEYSQLPCPPSGVPAAIVSLQNLGNINCCDADCDTSTAFTDNMRRPSGVIVKGSTPRLDRPHPNNIRPTYPQGTPGRVTKINDFYVSFQRMENKEYVWARVFIHLVVPHGRVQDPAIYAVGMECAPPPGGASVVSYATPVTAESNANPDMQVHYRLPFGGTTIDIFTTDIP